METKIISIDISPESTETPTENAGVMWEHNATQLVFNIDNAYISDYRYYLEYRSLLGTKVRTEYLELNTETKTVTYNIPITMSSLKVVECYFNIVSIDGDGNTVQVIKPHKFCLQFDYSPDTDNSLAKVNDFSVNALLEAIRLGTFKGDKGEKGDTGVKGDKGDKGDTGEVTFDYANNNFANAVKNTVSDKSIVIDDFSPISHTLDIKTTANETVYLRGKNLIPFNNKAYYGGRYKAGQTYEKSGVNFTINDDGSVYVKGTATESFSFPLFSCGTFSTGVHTVTLSGSPDGASSTTYFLRLRNANASSANYEDYGNGKVIENTSVTGSTIAIIVINGATIDAAFYPMLEFGETASDFVAPCESYSVIADGNGVVSGLTPFATSMSIFTETDTTVDCTYNQDTIKVIEEIRKELATISSYVASIVNE